jgi:hypothetical protein
VTTGRGNFTKFIRTAKMRIKSVLLLESAIQIDAITVFCPEDAQGPVRVILFDFSAFHADRLLWRSRPVDTLQGT